MQAETMDRDAAASPPPEVQQRAPLLSGQHPDDDADDSDSIDDSNLWCWCCPMYRCLFGGCTGGKNAQPCSTRTLDFGAHLLFWFSGMYLPGGTFRRSRWDAINAANRTKPGVFKSLKVVSRDMSVPSTKVQGLQIPIRVYEPLRDSTTGGNKNEIPPVMVYFHGGGFCILGADDTGMDLLCAKLCSKMQMVVVSVTYRLAPENPFPAAVQVSCRSGSFSKETNKQTI